MPKNIREKVYSLQNEMKKLPMRAKFVEKENLHLNFSFLGNIKERKLSSIRKTLREISSRYSKFKVKC
ncbi:MAG: RNA 2',3'-cyclic phosphodiesterase, partial [Candidatus Aenigmarchaeota archaeon]|nr:RNA 2',3'-cyclic phosphodiesterase [Candidatus Aenigmarchaeota archaeon]